MFCFDLPRERVVSRSYIPTVCTDLYTTHFVLRRFKTAFFLCKGELLKVCNSETILVFRGEVTFLNLSSVDSRVTADLTTGEGEDVQQSCATFTCCNMNEITFLF